MSRVKRKDRQYTKQKEAVKRMERQKEGWKTYLMLVSKGFRPPISEAREQFILTAIENLDKAILNTKTKLESQNLPTG